jgi:signal transduction histidine kinase
MKRKFNVSLTNRLAATYALFICLVLGILAFLVNHFSGIFFTALIKENIAAKSRDIAEAIGNQYHHGRRRFNNVSVEAMGMYFAREGYIITVEDENGRPVWDARSCDMQCCVDVINSITVRMEGLFGLSGALRKEQYPLVLGNRSVGTISIETYGPFFYSETETRFLASINRLLLITGIVLTGVSVIVSAALSRTIAKPILTAGKAARQIAQIYSMQTKPERPFLRINENFRTKELEELSRSINTLAEELEASDHRQKQLTSDIAHELRTPLSCLQVNLEAIIEGVYPMNREQLESCREEVLRLANLIQDLNLLTGLEWEHLTLNKTEFDLTDLLRVTAEQFKPLAAEKGIAINMDLAESAITADYDRLKQVFINILSNAVKYTDSGSITISMNKAGSTQCEVAVTDTGIGIPESDLSHVFERFTAAINPEAAVPEARE